MVADGPETLLNQIITSKFHLNLKLPHKNPFRKRRTTRTLKFDIKLDTIVIPKAMNNVGTITVFLPRVSAKNPQRCEDTMIPMKPTALKTPLSLVVKFKSHCATGKMKLMLTVSRKTQPRTAPDKMISA
jgi:hypothetical protein